MERNRTALIGLGEAGLALGGGIAGAIGYDRLFDAGSALRRRAIAAGIDVTDRNGGAVAGASLILSLVTADQAIAAARETAAAIAPGALFCDMNSVAPDTKRAAAAVIEAAGGRYVDVAVMAPVHPLRRRVPLLVGGPHAVDGAAALRGVGFADVRVLDRAVGAASAIKMIRSVMVKGIEALSAECALAAEAAGVRAEVIASLDASWPGAGEGGGGGGGGWARRFDYNLDRMMVHGRRRADEMDEVAATLDALGTGAAMSRAAAVRQRAIGALALVPPEGLAAKLAALLPARALEAAA